MTPIRFRFATTPDELRQVHELNHRTFVDEIPQHQRRPDGMLVDRFDAENTYLVAVQGTRVVGMVSVRDRRPFSLDAKVPTLDAWLPAGHRYCEVRLLAVDPACRGSAVAHGLLHHVARFCTATGFDAAVISAAVTQLPLYAHLGFRPIGPRVGTPAAAYQPMYVTLDAFRAATDRLVGRRPPPFEKASFLPGPVELSSAVQDALVRAPHSHRDAEFRAEFAAVRQQLCVLTRAAGAAIVAGSGTLANDMVAAQLAAAGGRGVVLVNGEFGERLVDHARRAGLAFDVERAEWGSAFDAPALAELGRRHDGAAWLWLVHHETSTGVLNDLGAAALLARNRGMQVCADCVSSIGLVPVDLSGIWLASGVSGKALGAPAGLAMVLWTSPPVSTPRAPRYLDVSEHAAADGARFTVSSAIVHALATALPAAARRLREGSVEHWTSALRVVLEKAGLHPLRAGACAAPALVTVMTPTPGEAERLGDALAGAGIAASYSSEYLRERNCIQFALMGECSAHKIALLERVLPALTKSNRLPALGAGSRSTSQLGV